MNLGDIEPWKLILGFLGTVVVAYFAYLGARHTANSSVAGVAQTSKVDAQESALQAWQELLEPYKIDVKDLRAELKAERDDRREHDKRVEKARTEAKTEVDRQLEAMSREIATLRSEVGEWKRLAKTIARWATRLRDEVLRLGGTVPATPEELLTLQAIEDASDAVASPAPPPPPTYPGPTPP